MLRVTPGTAYLKRTLRINYGWSQATPKDVKLDPAWDRSVNIWPGMVFMKTSGQNVTLINGTGTPYGLGGMYVGGDGIDEPLQLGVNVFTCWVMGPDAEFEVLAPAFDAALTWTDPGNGTTTLVHAQTTGATRGKLVPAGTANASAVPVARLIQVVSATKLVLGGLQARTA